jgi:uncharacterized membrane protein
LAGEEPAIEQLLKFSSQVDSANAVAHGQVLSSLMNRVGDDLFSKITAGLTEESKRTVWAAIEAGGAQPMKTAAPLTLQTLIPAKNIQEYRGLYVFTQRQSNFRDCAEPDARYIAIDETGGAERNYRRLLRFPYPGQPIFAEVKGYKTAYYGNEKLPAKFAGFFVVTEILELEVKNYRNTCIPFEFWALGNEPFWQVQISAGENVIEFKGMDDERTKFFTYLPPVQADSSIVYAVLNQETGDNIRISIKEEDCSDGMSDIRYRFKVEMTMNGQNFSGCGISFEDARGTEQDASQN